MATDKIAWYAPESAPYGKTYGHWTMEWWQWILGIPKAANPVLDRTGEFAKNNQIGSSVLFLAGKLADEKRDQPTRRCTVSADQSILIPVINCESNPLERPDLKTENEIIEQVRKDENTITQMECTVDGNLIPVQRVPSDPLIFVLRLVPYNIFDVEGGGLTYASADGYWVFLKPLPKGNHIVSFRGSCENSRLHSGAVYHIEVC
jgi:hypothetical protein